MRSSSRSSSRTPASASGRSSARNGSSTSSPPSSHRRRRWSGTASRGSFTSRMSSWETSIRLAPGDQLVADGRLLTSTDLHLDESILTGEALAIERADGRRGQVGLVRRRRHRIVRGRRRRAGELRRAHRRHGPGVSPSALAARARDRSSPLRAPGRDGAARGDADRRAVEAGRQRRARRRYCGRRHGHPHSRGARAARVRHLRGGGRPDDPGRRALAAVERDRIARIRRHDLRRQDGHLDPAVAAPRRAPARRRCDRACAR